MSDNESNWQRVNLGDVCTASAGGTPNRSDPLAYGGDIPWVKSGEVASSDIWTTEERITTHGMQVSAAKMVDAGSVLIAMYGATAGQVARLKIPAATNQAVLAIRPKGGVLCPDFLYHCLCQSKSDLIATCQGSGQPNLNAGIVKGLEIDLPPLPEQKKIAEILSEIDKGISLNKQAVMDLWVAREALCDELIRDKNIEQKKVGELVTHMTNGFVGTATPHYRDRGVRYLTSKNIRKDKIDPSRMIYISEEFHDANQKSSLEVGDVLMVQSGHIGTTAVVTDEYKDCNCHALILMRFDRIAVDPQYASLYFNSAIGKMRLSDIFVGSTVKHVNTGDLKKFKIPLPPLEKQKDHASKIHSLDHLILLKENRIQKLQLLKKAVADDLLSGRKRVSV